MYLDQNPIVDHLGVRFINVRCMMASRSKNPSDQLGSVHDQSQSLEEVTESSGLILVTWRSSYSDTYHHHLSIMDLVPGWYEVSCF